MLMEFDDMIADMQINKSESYSIIVTELVTKDRNLNILLVSKPLRDKATHDTFFYHENT